MENQSSLNELLGINTPEYKTFLVAGPCSVESEEQVMETAKGLAECKVNVLRGGVWKPRTRPGSFEGLGMEALKWLKQAGDAVNLPVAVEVANAEHVEMCLKLDIDVLWIGARTTTNPFSVQTLADSLKGVDKPIMIKNPISPDVELWIGAIERIRNAGISKIVAIHRGFASHKKSAFRNIPNWRIPIELKREMGDIPIICDPSHICGNRDLLLTVSQEAIDLLFNGLMIEVHTDPDKALSDSKQQLTPTGYKDLVDSLKVKKRFSDDKEFFEHINDLRKDIDKLDNDLIDLLANRMNIARQIGSYKRLADVANYQPDRWDEIIRSRTKTAADKNLSENFMLRVYQLIHEESLRQQEPGMPG